MTFICLILHTTGADPGFQVMGGMDLKKLGRAEGGANIFGVFRVKNHDFTPKNLLFSNCGGRLENFWGISCVPPSGSVPGLIHNKIGHVWHINYDGLKNCKY